MARALAGKDGAVAVEYAMIAVGIATVVVACYRTFFDRASDMLNVVKF